MKQDWQPIETAPKDGVRILVLDQRDGLGMCVASAGWHNNTPHEIEWHVVNDIVAHPTHWMPLPERPAIAMEARRAETPESGSVHDSAAIAQNQEGQR